MSELAAAPTSISEAPAGPLAVQYPALRTIASDVSRDGQRGYFALIAVELGIAFLAATLVDGSSISKVRDLRSLLTGLAAILLGAVLLVQVVKLLRIFNFDEQWFEGRAATESTKTAAWRYMMWLPPFAISATADDEFSSVLGRILHGSPAIQQRVARAGGLGSEVTDQMRATRSAPWTERRVLYLEARLDDQIGWYGSKATGNGRASRALVGVSLVLQIAAIAASVFLAMNPESEVDLVGVLTTAAASAVAWAQARRYDELKTTYRLAHDELVQIRARMASTATEDEFRDAVLDGEGAISREHTMWVAKSSSPLVWTIEGER
jgi:hypothetical protein